MRILHFCNKLVTETPPIPTILWELLYRRRALWTDLVEIASRGNKKRNIKVPKNRERRNKLGSPLP